MEIQIETINRDRPPDRAIRAGVLVADVPVPRQGGPGMRFRIRIER
jgi:hypothetical protein